MDLFLLTCVFSLSFNHANSATPCSDEGCVGPYKIKLPELPKINVTWDNQDTMVLHYPTKVTVHIGYRSSYHAYCYNGGQLDPNTGCDKIHLSSPPSKDEIRIWSVKNMCKIGTISQRGSRYWGSDASLCQSNPPMKWVHSSEFSFVNQEWLMFAHHTCLYDWRCGIKTTDFPVEAKFKEKKMVPVTYLGDGTMVELSKEGTFKQIDKDTSAFFEKVEPKDFFRKKLHCIHNQNDQILCQLDTDEIYGSYSGAIVEIDPTDLFGVIGPIVVKITQDTSNTMKLGAIPALEGGSKKVLSSSWLMSKYDASGHLLASASIEDLKPIVHNLMFVNSEMNYNLMNTLKSMQEMRKIMIEMIKSSGKVDDELIGNILGTHSKTKWFNKDLFHMCPCFQVQLQENSNCAGDYIFNEGRLVNNKGREKCSSYADRTIQDIKVFRQFNYSFAILSVPPATGTSSNWEGWSWLSEKKQSLINSYVFANESSSGVNGVGYFANESFNFVKAWFSFTRISSFVSYIALFFSVFALVRSC